MAGNATLLRICGTIGLFGAMFPIAADVISWMLAEDYSPIAQSISALAVGPSSWLIDIGLWSFVLACLAVGLGLWRLLSDARLGSGTAAALIAVAVCVAIIARVNQYAGTGNANANVHLWAVCGLAVFFAATSLFGYRALGSRSAGLARFSLAVGVVWIMLCPVYWFLTDEWSGAVERFMALLMIAWLVAVARWLRAPAAERDWRHAQA